MNERIEILKDLIEISKLNPSMKRSKIMQTLQRSEEDMTIIKMITEEMTDGEFKDLEENAVEDLIEAFGGTKQELTEDMAEENKRMNMEYEIKKMKDQMDELKSSTKKQLEDAAEDTRIKLEDADRKNRKLQESNNKLIESLSLTKNSELVTIKDEDINELYIKYIQNDEVSCDQVDKMNGKIIKSYYNVK